MPIEEINRNRATPVLVTNKITHEALLKLLKNLEKDYQQWMEQLERSFPNPEIEKAEEYHNWSRMRTAESILRDEVECIYSELKRFVMLMKSHFYREKDRKKIIEFLQGLTTKGCRGWIKKE